MTYPPQQPAGPWPPQPPPYAGQPQPAPPPANPRREFWLKGPGVIVVVVAVGLVLFGITQVFSAVKPKPSADVTVVSCELGGSSSLPSATVGLQVRNTGKTTHTFAVRVEYRDGGGSRVDTDTAYARDVAPGDTVRVDETTLLDAAVSGGTCNVAGIR
jgi:hypothetical protein